MTTLMLLINESAQQGNLYFYNMLLLLLIYINKYVIIKKIVILTKALKDALLQLKRNSHVDNRINTVATLFLTDYFSITTE